MAKPIIKWVGGKTQLKAEIEPLIKEHLHGNYYEPFIGGGAIAFDLALPGTTINDMNSELMNMYSQVRNKPDAVIGELTRMFDSYKANPEADYYKVRAEDRVDGFSASDPVHRAARFIYICNTSFNGLYRVNSKGYVNSPVGRNSNGSYFDFLDADKIKELSSVLKTFFLDCGSYEDSIKDAKDGDVIFLDPPYLKDSSFDKGGFVGYQKEGFGYDDTVHLEEVCHKLADKGVYIIITNNDTEEVRDIFSDWYINGVNARRSINSNGAKRSGKEVIITSE